MNILVFNAGSSSLRFDLLAVESSATIIRGKIERTTDIADAAREALTRLGDTRIDAVGHRIVHGGEQFKESVVLDATVEAQIDALSVIAPLHNPPNLTAYRAARQHLPGAIHVAVFDTAFHQTLPAQASTYAIPRQYREKYGIRRYGFHGISHSSVALRFPGFQRVISCHLGNGCSVCAIEKGRSIDTSMGFTPLEGLIMGTRSGDLDPGALLHLISAHGIKPAELLQTLNSESGLKGLSGVSNDMRDVISAADSGNSAAVLAVDAFCYRVRKYIGAYLAAMNGADAVVFTGGMGENSPVIRAGICEGLDQLGIEINPAMNTAASGEMRRLGNSRVQVWAAPAEEEILIARDTLRVVLRARR